MRLLSHVTRCRVLVGSHGDGEDDEVLQLEVEDPPRGLGARPQHQHAVLRTLERELVIMADTLTHGMGTTELISGNCMLSQLHYIYQTNPSADVI